MENLHLFETSRHREARMKELNITLGEQDRKKNLSHLLFLFHFFLTGQEEYILHIVVCFQEQGRNSIKAMQQQVITVIYLEEGYG